MPHLLLWLTFLPALAMIPILALPEKFAKTVALVVSLVGVGLAVCLYTSFDAVNSSVLQFPFQWTWIASYQIQFALGVDGISFPLVLLTKWMMPIAVLASWHEERRPRFFMASFLLLDCAMTGTFLATDIFAFYVFWELMLIPMILLIGIWGSANRIYAALKFFLYTFAGSIFMLAAILWLVIAYGEQFSVYSSQIADLQKISFPVYSIFGNFTAQDLVFLGFAIAFLIKVPLFPLHTWLPDAHVQAPTGGSILLAAVLLKMGTYGLMRFAIPICPESFVKFTPPLMVLSLIGIIYGAWVALQQTDMKKLVAYSSVSHLGFVVLGLCAMNPEAAMGAVLQSINHGLSTGALFLLVGMLYERRHTREFDQYGGLAAVLPYFSFFFVFAACSSMAVPGLNGFVGEFMILLGTFKANPLAAGIAVSAAIFGALYTLTMVRKVLFGEVTQPENKTLTDMSVREWAAMIPLALWIIVLGIAPGVLTSKFSNTMETYWEHALKKTTFDAGSAPQTEKVKRS